MNNRNLWKVGDIAFLCFIMLVIPYRISSLYELYDKEEKNNTDYAHITLEACILLTFLTLGTSLSARMYGEAQSRFRLWNQRHLIQGMPELKEALRPTLTDLENRFEALSREDKEILVTLELATIDPANQISLKYVCPISMSLILNPVYLAVNNEVDGVSFDLYDKSHISKWISMHPDLELSPLSQRVIIREGEEIFREPPALKEDCCDYMHKLSEALDTIRLNLTNTH